MRIIRTPLERADFENLLIPPGEDEQAREASDAGDLFADAPLAMAAAMERPVEDSGPLPARPPGPYRLYWRESTFLRAVGLHYPECVAALCEWGRRGVVDLERGHVVIPPNLAERCGRCILPARLRRRARLSLAVPMELELIPWSQTFATTWLALCPRRHVHLSRRYFRSGHALLDELTAGLLLHAR